MSLSQNQIESREQAVRTLQIIVAAMMLGVVMFVAIVVLAVPEPITPPGQPGAAPALIGGLQLITLAALLMGASALVCSVIFPPLMAAQGRSQIAREKTGTENPSTLSPASQASDAGRLLALFQTQTIVGSALAEGGAFFCVIAYMLERHWSALLMAAVLVGSLALRIPTRDRLAAWLDSQLALVQEERQRGL